VHRVEIAVAVEVFEAAPEVFAADHILQGVRSEACGVGSQWDTGGVFALTGRPAGY
jgi:hypothetical protein